MACSGQRCGFGPSCAGRRMAQMPAYLVERVIPWVPTRYWVISVPIPLRYWMASAKDLTATVHTISRTTIHKYYVNQAVKRVIERQKAPRLRGVVGPGRAGSDRHPAARRGDGRTLGLRGFNRRSEAAAGSRVRAFAGRTRRRVLGDRDPRARRRADSAGGARALLPDAGAPQTNEVRWTSQGGDAKTLVLACSGAGDCPAWTSRSG